ncbi:MAG: tyrosine-type recombinase/integrase, partial [Deltaproteobacteria bacterium]|nr:tyrosine-type recombinase/integrase [Deltaproteobacteria bacterium]
RRFLSESFSSGNNQVEKIRPVDVTNFILRYVPTVKRKTAQLMTSSLRAFFRYLHVRGRITADLAQSVPTVAEWKLANIPKHLQPEEVESLLKSCDQSKTTGLRDYAILLLLARLGLRAGAVTAMTLEDFNWEQGEVIILGKGPRKNCVG